MDDSMEQSYDPIDDFEDDPSYYDLSDVATKTEESTEPEEPADEFPPEIHQDVMGLLYLGSLTKECEVLGHRFVLKTLTSGEELALGQIVHEYGDTLVQAKAFTIATIAAAIVTVDGNPIVGSLGPEYSNTITTIRKKFEYIRDKWYWPVIEMLYMQYSGLVIRQAVAFQALEGK